jgi:hypothetical protein
MAFGLVVHRTRGGLPVDGQACAVNIGVGWLRCPFACHLQRRPLRRECLQQVFRGANQGHGTSPLVYTPDPACYYDANRVIILFLSVGNEADRVQSA